MAQIKVRDEAGNGLPRINIRISEGDNGSDAAIFDVFTDLAGNTGWPIPHWPPPQSMPEGHYRLWVNVENVDPRFESVSVTKSHDNDATITLTRTAPPPLARLVDIDRERHRFVNEHGERVFVRMLTAFMLYYRYLRGEDIRPQLEQWAAFQSDGSVKVRFNALRVFGMAHNIPTRDMGLPPFRPQDFADYIPRWPAFESLCGDFGFHILFAAFPDNAMIMNNLAEQQAFHGGMTGVLKGLYQLTNEWEAHKPLNSVDYTKFPKPPQLSNIGFAAEGLNPACWDWFDYHPRRSYPAHLKDQNLADNPNVVQKQRDGMLCENDRLGPGGGSASAGPSDAGTAFEIGGGALCYGLGTSFHSQAGKVASVYDPLTARLACEFLSGSV